MTTRVSTASQVTLPAAKGACDPEDDQWGGMDWVDGSVKNEAYKRLRLGVVRQIEAKFSKDCKIDRRYSNEGYDSSFIIYLPAQCDHILVKLCRNQYQLKVQVFGVDKRKVLAQIKDSRGSYDIYTFDTYAGPSRVVDMSPTLHSKGSYVAVKDGGAPVYKLNATDFEAFFDELLHNATVMPTQ